MKQMFLAEKTTDKSENRTNKNKRQVNGTIKEAGYNLGKCIVIPN